MCRIAFVVLFGFTLLAGSISTAQDGAWTCDDGPNDVLNAAKAALKDKDRDRAWTLLTQAEVLCLDNNARYHDARTLRSMIWQPADVILMFDGRKVDNGEHELFLVCGGAGSPTIILENGLDTGIIGTWSDVFPALTALTRTCMYDRLGQNLSEQIPQGVVRTTQDQVDDLVALLAAAEIPPPYVLVGHALAGLNVLMLVDQHPELIAGVVLADAAHPNQVNRIASVEPAFNVPNFPVTGERLNLMLCFEEASGLRDFGDRPLAVVTAGNDRSISPEANALWFELQEEYTTYSTNSRHFIAELSGHDVPNMQPQRVIEAVLWVLEELRSAEADD